MIFVDTGAWLAQFSKRDQYHAKALRSWQKLHTDKVHLVTSSPVLVETITLIAREINHSTAVRIGKQIYGWRSLTILRPVEEDEVLALAILDKFSDQKIGFVDCLSFALMRRYGIKTAFAYDRHFKTAGFELV